MQTASVHHRCERRHFLQAPFDMLEPNDLVATLDRIEAESCFRYVVTPNVDHVVRLRQTASLMTAYEAAWLSICDSRPIAALARLMGEPLPLMPGATLTEILFRQVIRPGDRVALVVADDAIGLAMRRAFPDIALDILVAPRDLGSDPAGFQACVDFVIGCEARFVFIAIGSPHSERIAFRASLDPRAKGIGLCIGAGLEFLIGRKRRAPGWMQWAGLEWAYRLGSEPRRLWRRYLYRVLPLAHLVAIEIVVRAGLRRGLPTRPAGG